MINIDKIQSNPLDKDIILTAPWCSQPWSNRAISPGWPGAEAPSFFPLESLRNQLAQKKVGDHSVSLSPFVRLLLLLLLLSLFLSCSAPFLPPSPPIWAIICMYGIHRQPNQTTARAWSKSSPGTRSTRWDDIQMSMDWFGYDVILMSWGNSPPKFRGRSFGLTTYYPGELGDLNKSCQTRSAMESYRHITTWDDPNYAADIRSRWFLSRKCPSPLIFAYECHLPSGHQTWLAGNPLKF